MTNGSIPDKEPASIRAAPSTKSPTVKIIQASLPSAEDQNNMLGKKRTAMAYFRISKEGIADLAAAIKPRIPR
jgi:hypothetical protein